MISDVVYPGEGTLGSNFVIRGSGIGPEKGKVLMGKTSLKCVWETGQVNCLLKKAVAPGIYDVTVVPKDKGAPSIVHKFVVQPPEVVSVDSMAGTIGAEITIRGNFLGIKKGKVYLAYEKDGKPKKKTCKVNIWPVDTGEGEIVFAVPKLPPGAYELIVTNGVGSAEAGLFTIE
jgi:hypothetical protein